MSVSGVKFSANRPVHILHRSTGNYIRSTSSSNLVNERVVWVHSAKLRQALSSAPFPRKFHNNHKNGKKHNGYEAEEDEDHARGENVDRLADPIEHCRN